MIRTLLFLALFTALPANADSDRKYKRYKEPATYYCEYYRGERYCYKQEEKRYHRRKETTCVWVEKKNFGIWICDEKSRKHRY
jgi:hypothetical protein